MKLALYKTCAFVFFCAFFFQANIFSENDNFSENTKESVSETENRIFEIDKTKLPVLETLSSRNPLFRQFTEEVEFNYKQKVRNREQNRSFYLYTLQKNDTLMRVASRSVIPYETIASINGIAHIDDLREGSVIVLPNFQGIFVSDEPKSSIEMLVAKKYENETDCENKIWYKIDGKLFYFLLGEHFTPTERAFFLDASFKMPVKHAWLSSKYGMRKSPITGKQMFHGGIDLAAPWGTAVLACKSGEVISTVQNDAILGNYVIVRHGKTTTSVYGHLSAISVQEGELVQSGDEIGKVGETGLTTGPHLHFEIRVNGKTVDPQKYLR